MDIKQFRMNQSVNHYPDSIADSIADILLDISKLNKLKI